MMTEFGKAIKEQEFPLLVEDINIDYYKAPRRRIHHVFKEANRELETLIINFAHSKRCAVLSHCYSLSRYKMKKAVRTLIENDYIELILNHYHNQFATGRARVFQRTALFEETFKFRSPKRIVVNDLALVKPSTKPIVSKPSASHQPTSHYWAVLNTNIWHSSKKYQSLINNVELSLSNGGQVFKEVWLFRHGARLYQRGANNYQSLSGDERKLLLINNQPTIELDYKSLHPNLLLNKTGNCTSDDTYEHILEELGLRRSKSKRNALKLIMMVAINIDNAHGFFRYANKMTDKDGNHPTKQLAVRPIDIYRAIIKAYPALQPYVCTGKHALSLQQEDSEIMIDVLETLANRGVPALPVHDSVIVPVQHKDLAKQTMIDCYKKHTGFTITVR